MFFTGPLSVADEGGHLYRSYLVSEGYCTGIPAVGNLVGYPDLNHQVVWRQLSPNTTGRDLLNMVDDAHGLSLSVVSLYYAVNLYSCVPYLPAGAALRLGRVFTGSPLTLMYIGRLANLLFYLLMVLLAMQLLPEFGLPLAVLALMPMALHQAASLSADAVTNALGFVLTAYILHLALADRSGLLRKSEYLLLAAGAILSGLCKSNAGLLFLVVLIPAVRFPNRWTRWLTVVGCLGLAYGTVAAWQSINVPNSEVHQTLKLAAGIDPSRNLAFIFQHPPVFLGAAFRTVPDMAREYLEEFVGRLGALELRLPVWIPWVYLVLLLAAATAYRGLPQLSRRQRILLAAIFLLNAGSLLAAVWTTEMPEKTIATEIVAGRGVITGLQGRYLIPFASILLLAVSGIAARRVRKAFLPAIAVCSFAVVVLVNAISLQMLWDRYQAHSSTVPNRIRMALRLQFSDTPESAAMRYDHLLVRRPGVSEEDSKVYIVLDGRKHWVRDARWLTAHGFRWPEDVNTIPGADLEKIPEGDLIQ